MGTTHSGIFLSTLLPLYVVPLLALFSALMFLKLILYFVVQLLSCVWLFATPWTAACQASLSFTISWSFLKLISIETVILSDRLILYRPLILWPSIFPSIKVFCNELALRIRWPKYWNFSISPFNVYSGFISFRIGWFDLLAVQGTLKSLLQHMYTCGGFILIFGKTNTVM